MLTKLLQQSGVPEWAWIALALCVLFVLVYVWARGGAKATKRDDNNEVASSKPGGSVRHARDASSNPPPPPLTTDVAVAAVSDVASPAKAATSGVLPRLADDDSMDDVDPTFVGDGAAARLPDIQIPAKQIIYDEDAAIDEHTHPGALILVSGTAQTDKGLRRKRNEDAILTMPEHGVYVVADGMGGYRGGEIASNLAVKAIELAFQSDTFEGKPHDGIPRRGSELARSIQMANAAILQKAQSQRELAGMGTTICAARFSSNKQRLYVGHVGDSRLYRLRNGKLAQLTHDHTMGDLGVVGEAASHLSRAVGIWPTVPVDILLVRPRPRDLYLLCSDGLSKMVSDHKLGQILHPAIPPDMVVDALIDAANAKGGNDNISAIVIRVDDAATMGVVTSDLRQQHAS